MKCYRYDLPCPVSAQFTLDVLHMMCQKELEQKRSLPFCATYSVLDVRKISPFPWQNRNRRGSCMRKPAGHCSGCFLAVVATARALRAVSSGPACAGV